jgi:hypothetical protein
LTALPPRSCPACDVSFNPSRRDQKFCSAACRKRAHKAPDLSSAPADPGSVLAGAASLTAVTRRELQAAGQFDTWDGALALRLAWRIEFGIETGSSVASLSRELRAVMATLPNARPIAEDGVVDAVESGASLLRLVPNLYADAGA